MNDNKTRTVIKNHQVLIFFVLTLFAWVIWISQALQRYGLIDYAPSLQSPLNALTVWSPGIAAIVLTLITAGKRGVTDLFKMATRFRVPFKWYLAALLLEPAKWAAALGIDRLLGHSYKLEPGVLLSTFSPAVAYMMPVAIIFALPNALGEELGWRGYALPRLQKRHGALLATLIIGLFWGFWHIPAWIAWGNVEISLFPILLKTATALPAAVLFTWLFNNSGGSLLLMCLFHASITMRWYLLSPLPTPTEKILSWVIAIIILIFTKFSSFRR